MQFVYDKEKIRQALSFDVILERYGLTLKKGSCPCPFHQETKPSFSVNEEKGLFYCFGCQANGDIFSFLMRVGGIEFNEAVKLAAEIAGIAPTTKKQLDRKILQRKKEQAVLKIKKEMSEIKYRILSSTAITLRPFKEIVELDHLLDAWIREVPEWVDIRCFALASANGNIEELERHTIRLYQENEVRNA